MLKELIDDLISLAGLAGEIELARKKKNMKLQGDWRIYNKISKY